MTVGFGKLTECFRFVCITVKEEEHGGRGRTHSCGDVTEPTGKMTNPCSIFPHLPSGMPLIL